MGISRDVRSEQSVVAQAEWTARQLVLGTLTVIGVAMVFLFLYRLYMVVFLLFAAIALQVALSPVVEWLHRRNMPRGLSVLSLYGLLLVSFGLALWFGVPPVMEQSTSVVQDIPAYYESGRTGLIEASNSLLRRLGRLLPEEFSMPMLMELANVGDDGEEATGQAGWAWVGLRSVFAVLAIFVLAYYWTLEGSTIVRRVIMKAPASRREELRVLMSEFEAKIGAYFRGTILLCVLIGVASTLAFFAIGIPNAILLGLIMGIFEAIPVLGPVLGAIPAILITMAFDPDKTLWVIGALLIIQGLEGNILVPKVMDQSVGVNPIVSLLALAAFGTLFGIGGALLAIPMAAILQILLGRILFNSPIRQDLATPPPGVGSGSRSSIGVLRVETQAIIQDLHKGPWPKDEEHQQPPAQRDSYTLQAKAPLYSAVQTEDRLEGLAADLDALLAALEKQTSDARPQAAAGQEEAKL